MKLQNLTVIFSIIIIPVTLILSAYIGIQIDTASLQQSYDTTLMDATYDAVVAFELNTANDSYSNNADAVRRDIQAAINTFFTSLAKGLGTSGANQELIQPYVPAVLVTLYDGYYIYSPAEYSYNTKIQSASGAWVDTSKTGYTHILKPYVYYSQKYTSGSNYVTVNYSLDNYIAVYGMVNGQIIAKSGYIQTNEVLNYISNNGETLSETVAVKNSAGNIEKAVRNYVYRDGQKVYKIGSKWYTITDLELMEYKETINEASGDTSAKQYKQQSTSFMQFLRDSGIINIVTENGKKILDVSATYDGIRNDPEDSASLFNQHKRKIIKQSIQDNLNNSMALYNIHSNSMGTNAEFHMPKLSETDWEKILTNVNFVTFMQGLPVGNTLYNNYSIITSTNNKQYIDQASIHFVSGDKYHTIYDTEIHSGNVIGYKLQDFKKVKYEDKNGQTQYYYRRPEYACYNCKVSTSSPEGQFTQIIANNPGIRTKYYTALARERYNLNKVTKIFM